MPSQLQTSTLVLTADQANAVAEFVAFLADPSKDVFVIEGFAGTGKSTLVTHLLDQLPAFQRSIHLLNPDLPLLDNKLTATTNKAAEALHMITQRDVSTIHSTLGLRVHTDQRTRKSTLMPTSKSGLTNTLLFIDEASYVDEELLKMIFTYAAKCKIVFMGDPAQLTPVNSEVSPVFMQGFPTVRLTQVVRQAAGNPIVQLATQFRETVTSGQWFKFTPDGQHVAYVSRSEFEQDILKAFSGKGRHGSKVLGWTNNCVIGFNNGIRDRIAGDPDFQVGDYAVNNNYVQVGRKSIKTDATVLITGIDSPEIRHGVHGKVFTLNQDICVFVPDSRKAVKNLERKMIAEGNESVLYQMSEWADLREIYACTVNKSQGSTYDQVFIDLDDISKCRSKNQVARLLYVAVSRARHRAVFTGELK